MRAFTTNGLRSCFYERELGVSTQTVWGIKKATFGGQDFGTIVATTYAVAH